jgi:hypothetical protein
MSDVTRLLHAATADDSKAAAELLHETSNILSTRSFRFQQQKE